MNDINIDVINYLDKQADVGVNKKIVPFDIQKLMDDFPDVDELSLRRWYKEWAATRNLMLNIEF